MKLFSEYDSAVLYYVKIEHIDVMQDVHVVS